MYLVKAGKRTLNLTYLICAEDTGARVVRVTLESGKEFDLAGPDADEFRSGLTEAMTLLGFTPGTASESVQVPLCPVRVADPGVSGQ